MTMKKLLLILLTSAAIWSCSSTKEVMDSWIGATKQSVILSWGPPARTTSDGGTGEILVYARQIYNPYGLSFYDYKMFYVDNAGKIYYWQSRREQIPPTQIDLNVYRRY